MRSEDRGDVMLWVVVSLPFLLAGISALLSASQQWEMQREVQALAAAAARAGAQGDVLTIRQEALDSGVGAIDHPGRLERIRQRVMVVVDSSDDSGRLDVTVEVVLGQSPASITVQIVAPVDHALPAFGLASTVVGRATAITVEGAG